MNSPMPQAPICMVCWMNLNKGKSCRIGPDKTPRTCRWCGHITQADLREDVNKGGSWELFKAAVLLLVIPVLIIYLCGRH